MEDDQAAFFQRSQALIDSVDGRLAAALTKGDAPPIAVLEVSDDSDVEMACFAIHFYNCTEYFPLQKAESDEEGASATLLHPHPMRPRRSRDDERKSKEAWYKASCWHPWHVIWTQRSASRWMLSLPQLQRYGLFMFNTAPCSTLPSQKQEAQKELTIAKKESKALGCKNSELQDQLDQKHEREASSLVAVDVLKAKSTKRKAQIKELNKTVVQQQAEIAELMQEIRKFRDEKAVLSGVETTAVTVEAANLKRQIATLRQDKERLVKVNEGLIGERNITRAINQCKNRLNQKLVPQANKVIVARSEDIHCATDNLFAFLAQDPSTQSFMNNVLYLPHRLLSCAPRNYIAFAPSARYNDTRCKWEDGSDLAVLAGSTRELFVVVTRQNERTYEDVIAYAGTYLCHDLGRAAYPPGTKPPRSVPDAAILEVAFGMKTTQDDIDITPLIKQRFPSGTIDIEVMGLQLVGYNMKLCDALKGRLSRSGQQPPPVVPAKRAAEMGIGEGSKKPRT
ncbi:hypothetical protein MIND_00412100 [Mycena indigotica]|uniref:Uncharacterized protein n=1 Tax=Mycena indigotica TaxID=2126181 RepID=A0A8H6SVG3_9AGAR|nr:uncharacterized protein MIND_00412100 [Mycena indigotica]KAF7306216.1 hypothetical protein MIND_00412100 [Mycena indigotica]